MISSEHSLDPDFSREVLEDLYTYRRKRPAIAWLLWASVGWLGAHRFYLERPFTGVVQLFTGGGALVWWVADAWLINRMVREHNAEQAHRKRSGEPPVELAFMPPLRGDALHRVPAWVVRWDERTAARRGLRLAGDVLVLLVAGTGLGAMVTAEGADGALEAVVAVVLLAGMVSLGAGPAWLDDVPGARALARWTHRLRLFYWHNAPGSPPMMLLRSVLGVLWAPFRAKDRAEVRLYVELGAVFSAVFLLLDIVPEAVIPLFVSGQSIDPEGLVSGWLAEALTTFFLTYALAAPVGGILTLYLLVRPTHTLPRILAGFTIASIALGMLAGASA